MNLHVATLVLAFILSAPALAQPNISETIAQVDRYVENAVAELRIPGASLALVYQGELVHSNQWGMTGRSAQDGLVHRVTAQTPFTVGSNSKALTVYGLMTLVQDETVSLNDPVQRHLPWFDLRDSSAASKITLEQLISHTSGISAFDGYRLSDRHTVAPDALENMVRALSQVEPIGEPGAVYEYSPANYAVLGAVIEAISGMRFADFMQARVFGPLGMNQAAAHYDDAKANGWQPGYRAWFGAAVPHAELFDSAGAPYGYMAATAQDMAQFLIALQRPVTLSSENTQTLLKPLVERGNNSFYGYGWRVYQTEGYKKVWHSGSTADFRSEVLLLPASGWGAVLLTNRSNGLESYRLTQVSFGIERLFNGDDPVAIVRTIPVANLMSYGLTFAAILVLALLFRRQQKGSVRRHAPWRVAAVLLATVAASLIPVVLHFTGMPLRSLQLFVPDISLLMLVITSALLASAVIAARLGFSGRVAGNSTAVSGVVNEER